MSKPEEDEPMDTSECQDSSSKHQASRKEVSLITVTVKWLKLAGPSKKPTTELQFALQTWFNKNKTGTTCSVLSQLDDGSFMIKIEPASTWSEFQKLNGQTLNRKDKTVTITSINGRSPQSTLQDDVEMDKVKQNVFSGAAADSTAEELTCVLPVSYFWYLSNVYTEQLQHIEEATGVKITAEEKVTFGSSGDQQKALSEFINLYQKSLREFSFKAVPIQDVHSETRSNTKKVIQKSDNKVLVQDFNNSVGKSTDPVFNRQLASVNDKDEAAGDDEDEKCCICMDTFTNKRRLKCKHEFCSECLKKSEESVGPICPVCKDVFGVIEGNQPDSLVTAGLTVDEEHWKLIAASCDGHLHGIRSKFGVDFNVSQSDVCKDKVDVKVRYRRPGGNASMQSHAARALGPLRQKIQMSPIPLTHLQGASGFSGSPQNRLFNGQLVSVKDKDEAAGDDEDEKCCICMDAFTNKRRLKCKHEFCSECLKKSEECLGPFCPVCKDVFGVIEGNQPDSLVTAGRNVDEEHWKLITGSYDGHLHGIRSKFGADFNVSQSDVCRDKVDVKVRYRRPGGNASMQSHAARALGPLRQKIQMSPIPLTHLQGASGFSGSPQNQSYGSKPEGSSTDPVFNGQLVSVKDKDEAAGDDEDEKCCICLDAFTNKRRLKCKHEFCSECLKKSEECLGPVCPVCKDAFGVIEGNQPDGQMRWRKHSFSLPGFYGCGTIEINYIIPHGTQTDKHPSPGQPYHGINRTAYLPNNKEGNEVLHLLKRAFDQKLIFTVGSSRTTGLDNQVTWNDIHHKTSISGGPQCFGYPDPDYLSRVKEELKAKGIK